MVDVDGCVFCSEAHSSCTFAGDASLPTAVLRSPDWIFLCAVAVKKQMHSAGFGFSYHFGGRANLQIRPFQLQTFKFADRACR